MIPEVVLYCLQKFCQWIIQGSNKPEEQAVIHQEVHLRLLAAFITGAPGRQVRLQMTEMVDKALCKAIIAINADKEERALLCEAWIKRK
jgi:hypothetical protein